VKASPGLIAAAVIGAVSLALGGCVSLFPKTPPAQLYRFGAPAVAETSSPSPSAGSTNVVLAALDFDAAAAGDQILTVTGQDAAYIAGARWVSPASDLFQDALVRSFQTTPGAPRLIQRSRLLTSSLMLTLDVQAFETRYEQGLDAAPTVMIQVHAQLVRADERTLVGERTFLTRAPASENRVGSIVQAYDEAVSKTLADLAGWTASAVAAEPSRPSGAG
jgi:cholesterol transport system auxiliary component